MEAVRPVAPRYNSMDCDVEPGAIVMVEALRSVGIKGDTPFAPIQRIAPLSGFIPTQLFVNKSNVGAPVRVPEL